MKNKCLERLSSSAAVKSRSVAPYAFRLAAACAVLTAVLMVIGATGGYLVLIHGDYAGFLTNADLQSHGDVRFALTVHHNVGHGPLVFIIASAITSSWQCAALIAAVVTTTLRRPDKRALTQIDDTRPSRKPGIRP